MEEDRDTIATCAYSLNKVVIILAKIFFRDGANRDQADKVASCAVSRADGNADA
jgi:hypothetical protein